MRNYEPQRRFSPTSLLKRLLREDRGVAAIEFGLVGPTFILLLVMTMELAIVLWTQSVLDFATQTAARTIQVGSSTSSAAFSTILCNNASQLIPCASLQVSVRSASTFAALSSTLATDGNGNMTNTGFNIGTASTNPGSAPKIIVQVGYNRPYIIAWVGTLLGVNDASLLVSTVAFQQEAY